MDTAAVNQLDATINKLGAAFYFDPTTIAHAAGKGIDNPFVLYGAGRAGVMGDVNVDQVLSAFAFFDAAFVHRVWDNVAKFGTPSSIAAIYVEGMALAAAEHWHTGHAAIAAGHADAVNNAVAPLGLALFTGWRSVPRNGDPVHDGLLAVMTLRELRGDINIQSVAGAGLSAIEAEIGTRGTAGAELHGWKPPYPDPASTLDRLAVANAATSSRMTEIYASAISDDAFAELDASATALLATP